MESHRLGRNYMDPFRHTKLPNTRKPANVVYLHYIHDSISITLDLLALSVSSEEMEITCKLYNKSA
jgi:hypothetical protein